MGMRLKGYLLQYAVMTQRDLEAHAKVVPASKDQDAERRIRH